MAALNVKKLMPSGTEFGKSGHAVWIKKGGYADATLKKFRLRIEAAGFTKREFGSGSHANPDGSTVGTATYYHDAAGNVIGINSSYGVTARDNRFRIEFHPHTTN